MAVATIPITSRANAAGVTDATARDIVFAFAKKVQMRLLAKTIIPEIATTEYEKDLTSAYGVRILQELEVEIKMNDRVIGASQTGERVDYDFIDFIPDRSARWKVYHDLEKLFFSNQDRFAQTAASAARRLKIGIEQDCFGHWYADAAHAGASAGRHSNVNLGASGAPLVLTPQNFLDELSNLTLIARQNNWPMEPGTMALVLPPELIQKLEQSELRSYFFTGEKSYLVHPDAMMQIGGWTIYASNNLTYVVDGGGATAVHAFGAWKEAIAFAHQLSKQDQVKKEDFVTVAEGLDLFGRKTVRPEGVIDWYVEVKAA